MKDLTLKEQKFIEIYTNPDSETFGNKTRSYMVAYSNPNERSSSVMVQRVLANTRVKQKMEDLMEKNELDFGVHLKTLDKKLNALAEKGEIGREELMAIRLGLEAQGRLGSGTKNIIGIGVNGFPRSCEGCPNHKPLFSEDIMVRVRARLNGVKGETTAEDRKQIAEETGKTIQDVDVVADLPELPINNPPL